MCEHDRERESERERENGGGEQMKKFKKKLIWRET